MKHRMWMGFCLYLAAALAEGATTAGYRGDGTGVIQHANPPVRFGEADVLWATPLPGWGHGSPVVVKDKVFVGLDTCPGDFPSLLCLDAATGKVLWQRELNHLTAAIADPKQREQVTAAWHGIRQAVEAARQAKSGQGGGKGSGDGRSAIDKDALKRCQAAGLSLESWNDALLHNSSLSCVGHMYPTPVSDGEFVYAVTAHNGFFCFDLAGNQKWVAFSAGHVNRGGGDDFCKAGRSPLLYRGMLLSDINNKVRAFDAKTGKELWAHQLGGGKDDVAGSHTVVSPRVFRVGNTDLLWACGATAYELPGGKPLPVEGWDNEGFQVEVNTDQPDTLFFGGAGEHCGWEGKGGKGKCKYLPPAAVKFNRIGDALKAQVLWNGINGASGGGSPGHMLYHAGKLYLHTGKTGLILDAATGKVLAGGEGRGSGAVPATRHLLLLAADRLYGFSRNGGKTDGGGGALQVFDLAGKKLAENKLPMPQFTPEQQAWYRRATGGNEPSQFSYGYPFALAGNRIYVRGYAHLLCISAK